MNRLGRLRLRGKIIVTMLPALLAVVLMCVTLVGMADPLTRYGDRLHSAMGELTALHELRIKVEHYVMFAEHADPDRRRIVTSHDAVREALREFLIERQVEQRAVRAIDGKDQDDEVRDVSGLSRAIARVHAAKADAEREHAAKQLGETYAPLVIEWIADETREIERLRRGTAAWLARLRWALVTIGLLGLALTALAGYLTYRSVHAPVAALGNATRRVAHGDYSLKILAQGTDELAELAYDFNYMTGELERQRRELGARESQMKEFFAMLTHELRAPLNAVMGLLELVQEKEIQLSARSLKNMELARESALNMRVTIDDILDLSKLEAGKLEIRPIDFAPQLLLEELTEKARVLLGSKPVEVRLEIDAPLGLFTSDAGRVRQVLMNLVSNACRYTEQGLIVLRSRRLSGGVLDVSVSDTGIGIRTDMKEFVFEAYRQDERAQELGGGTGLGLAIVRKLVSLLGGQVSLESEFGRGSTFNVTFANLGEI